MWFIGMHASQAHLQAGIRSAWVPVQHGIIDSIVVGRGCEMKDIGKLLHFVIPSSPYYRRWLYLGHRTTTARYCMRQPGLAAKMAN